MIGRLLEDGFHVGRFIFYYWKAPQHVVKLGFSAGDEKMTARARATYAWHKMNFKL